VTLFAALLLVAAGLFGHRWLGARAENAQLRAQIAVLKRRLERRDAA
jgi:hypothetical protein